MLLHSDGFDSHANGGTLADGGAAWGAQVGVAITASVGKFGGKALRLAATTVGSAAFAVASAVNPAFAFWVKAATRSNPVPLLADSAGALLTLNVDGSLVVADGAGTTRITLPAGSVPDATWVWVEVSYRSGGVNSSINGVPIGSPYVGAYTVPDVAALKLLNSTGTGIGQIDVDDFIVWDDQGSFFNTYGLSPRRIQLLRPNGPGTSSAWVPAGPTNWESVDAPDWAGGAGVTATVAGQKDRYAFTDLASVPGAIDAVVLKTRQQNVGSDPATLTHVSGNGVTEVSGAAQTISTVAPGVLETAFYRDPSGAAWTPSTVNGNEFGEQLGI